MENKFVNGLWVYKPQENTPEFVKASLSFSADFSDYLKANETPKGFVKIDILESKDGKYYAKLNTWTAETAQKEVSDSIKSETKEDIKVDEIPF